MHHPPSRLPQHSQACTCKRARLDRGSCPPHCPGPALACLSACALSRHTPTPLYTTRTKSSASHANHYTATQATRVTQALRCFLQSTQHTSPQRLRAHGHGAESCPLLSPWRALSSWSTLSSFSSSRFCPPSSVFSRPGIDSGPDSALAAACFRAMMPRIFV